MTDMSFFEADNHGPEFRQRQPLRHLTPKHAALGFSSGFAFPGDDKHKAQAVEMGTAQKLRERVVCARLSHAMQIEPGFDLLFPA